MMAFSKSFQNIVVYLAQAPEMKVGLAGRLSSRFLTLKGESSPEEELGERDEGACEDRH